MTDRIAPFKLERYFAKYEFSAKYLLSSSDCESLGMQELLSMADEESLALWRDLKLGYTESQGHPLLRQQIAATYQNIDSDQVLILAPEEGIFIALQTLLQPGDRVITTFPAYQSLYEIGRSLGCEVVPWSLQVRNGAWQLDVNMLEDLLDESTKLLIINFPHNPTGYLPTRTDIERIVDLCRKKDTILFSDEMYRLLEYDARQRLPAICDLYERGITLSGLSKSLALPGLRMGWLAARDTALFQRWLIYKDYTTICSSAPSEILALVALRAQQRILNRNLDIIRTNLETAELFFAQFPHLFEWLPPQAGSIAFPRLVSGVPVDEFCLDIITNRSIMLAPGNLFDFPGSHFRLGLGRRNFHQAIDRLRPYLRQKYP
jgi:aspartate/methionine/tyrosine aminotransferase